MRWRGRRQSENVEFGGSRRPRTLALGGGAGGRIILLLLVLLGADPRQLLQQVGNDPMVNIDDPGGNVIQTPEQQEARGHVRPETFTHGTSAQRVRWFRRGLETGDLSQGDTFNANEL